MRKPSMKFLVRKQIERICLHLGIMFVHGKSNDELIKFITSKRPNIHLLGKYGRGRDMRDIIEWFHENEKDALKQTRARHTTNDGKGRKAKFYKSWEWQTLRMEVLKERGARCECCGATPAHRDISGDPVVICVDHIKPISKYWELRLDKDNMQCLCRSCNMGKGAWDETDWREDVNESECDNDNEIPAALREQLRYSI